MGTCLVENVPPDDTDVYVLRTAEKAICRTSVAGYHVVHSYITCIASVSHMSLGGMICISVPVQTKETVYAILSDGPVVCPIMRKRVGVDLGRQ